jgi:hypothetical protein
MNKKIEELSIQKAKDLFTETAEVGFLRIAGIIHSFYPMPNGR